jgi:heat-inducible transcriptional repressor
MDQRQREILRALISAYVDTAEPVGSAWLSENLDLDLSPATIRNELHALELAGYLMHPHTSAGRIPTDKGYRLFVDQFLPELILDFEDQFQLGDQGDDGDYLQRAVKAIAKLTQCVAIGISAEKKVYYTGIANLLKQPEFQDSQKSAQIVEILEDLPQLLDLFKKVPADTKSQVLIGEESTKEGVQECSILMTYFGTSASRGMLGVIGPKRMRYDYNQAILKHFSQALGLHFFN